MAAEVFRIGIPIEAVDKTAAGIKRASASLAAFERQKARVARADESQARREFQNSARIMATNRRAASFSDRQARQDYQSSARIMAINKRAADFSDRQALRQRQAQMVTRGRIFGGARAGLGAAISVPFRILDLATAPLRMIGGAITSTLGLLGIGLGGAAAIAGGVIIPLKVSTDISGTRRAMTVLLGDADRANKLMAEMTMFAEKTPFRFQEVAEGARMMLAFGFAADEVIPKLTIMGDTAAALNVPIDRIILAIGQMRASGRLMGQDMRQLQMAGVPVFEILAKATGKSERAIKKMSEQGDLSFGKFMPLLLAGMQKRYGSMMDEFSRTTPGLISTIKDFFSLNILKAWGDGIDRVVNPALRRLVGWFDANRTKLAAWAATLADTAAGLTTRFVSGVEAAINAVRMMADDPAFQQADFFGKMEIAWSRLIVDPFITWWASEGAQRFRNFGIIIGGTLAAGIAETLTKFFQENPWIRPLVGAAIGGMRGGLPGAIAGTIALPALTGGALSAISNFGRNAVEEARMSNEALDAQRARTIADAVTLDAIFPRLPSYDFGGDVPSFSTPPMPQSNLDTSADVPRVKIDNMTVRVSPSSSRQDMVDEIASQLIDTMFGNPVVADALTP